ncbi:MAG: SGNH/GDSL hydrolase family protein [Myxococcales bacterium]|nr:SGNH/GDSL hydrolase family protein [Myxococcales bacterium]
MSKRTSREPSNRLWAAWLTLLMLVACTSVACGEGSEASQNSAAGIQNTSSASAGSAAPASVDPPAVGAMLDPGQPAEVERTEPDLAPGSTPPDGEGGNQPAGAARAAGMAGAADAEGPGGTEGTEGTEGAEGAAGTDGPTGADGAAGTNDPADPPADASGEMAEAPTEDAPMPPMDLGVGDGSDVVTIGDSWMDYALSGGGIEGGLRRAGKSYRNYSRSGTRFLNGVIPRQYDRAKASDPNILTVIMTGGGNDILQGAYSCDTAEACERYVNDLSVGLGELWTRMSNDGVRDVIYIGYSRDAGRPPAEGAAPTMRPVIEICEKGPIRCHRLATTDLVMGDLADGIHPARAANDRIAAAVLEMMEREGMRR